MSISILQDTHPKPWLNTSVNSMICQNQLDLPYLGDASCLCCVDGVVEQTSFPPSGGIGPSTTTTFPANVVIYSDGVHLAGDVTNFSFNDSTQLLTATNVTSNTIKGNGFVANTALYANGSQAINSSSTTATELGYVHGVTSAVQTQLNAIVASIPSLPVSIANGGTNSNSFTSTAVPYFDGTKLNQDVSNFSYNHGTSTLFADNFEGQRIQYVGGAQNFADLSLGQLLDNTSSTSVDVPNRNLVNAAGTTMANWTGTNISVSSPVTRSFSLAGNGINTVTVANLQTVGAVTSNIFSATTINSTTFNARVDLTLIDKTDSSANNGLLTYWVSAAINSSGVATISSLASLVSILGTNVLTASSTVTSSGANIITVNVVGITGKTIDWFIKIDYTSQS